MRIGIYVLTTLPLVNERINNMIENGMAVTHI